MSASPESRPLRAEAEGTNDNVGNVAAHTTTPTAPNDIATQRFYPSPTPPAMFVPTYPAPEQQYMLASYQPFPSYYPIQMPYISQESQDEALIAVLMIDMLIRGGNDAREQYQTLADRYPRAAAIAQHCAEKAFSLPLPLSSVPNGSDLLFGDTEQNFIIDRIRVASIAWFCCMIGALVATVRIWTVVVLAIAAAVGKMTENDMVYEIIKEVVDVSLRDHPRRQLYRWVFNHLTEDAGLGDIDIDAAAVLMGPFVMSIMGFFIGGIVGVMVNVALRMIGGIRIRTRRPHQN